jgi:hypothetical protein
MMLGGKVVPLKYRYNTLTITQVDPQDPFNQFWNKLEQMLDNLSQPVAFATIPLTSSINRPEGSKDASGASSDPSEEATNDATYPHINGSHAEQQSIEDQLSNAMEDDDLISGV